MVLTGFIKGVHSSQLNRQKVHDTEKVGNHRLGVLSVILSYVHSCVRPEVRLPPDECILCNDCYEKKSIMATSGSLLVFCTA